MEDTRSKTLQTLSSFIESQKAMLNRTQHDIERLRHLQSQVASKPVSGTLKELRQFTWDEYRDIQGNPEENIDWTLFRGHDTSALQTLALTAKSTHSQREQPHTTQRSKLSALQQLVQQSRLEILGEYLDPPSDTDEPPPCQSPSVINPSLHRTRGPRGLFVRNSSSGKQRVPPIHIPPRALSPAATHNYAAPSQDSPMDIDTSTASSSTPPPPPPPVRNIIRIPPLKKSARTRRPSTKIRDHDETENATQFPPRKKSKLASVEPISMDVKPSPSPPTPIATPPPPPTPLILSKQAKPKPETYKQAWSMAEQRQLDSLLVEYPEGSVNRWKCISQAMQGRRTPRQVASRVQKYNEKLKRFGLMDEGTSTL